MFLFCCFGVTNLNCNLLQFLLFLDDMPVFQCSFCCFQMTSLFGYTPLFRAICSKNLSVVRILLSQDDIDVNVRSRMELHAPLLEAILNRYQPAVDMLIAVPTINLNIRNFRQETLVIAATRWVVLDKRHLWQQGGLCWTGYA